MKTDAVLLRYAALPASWLYGSVVRLRNFLYDRGWLRSTRPPVATICVGNLTTGGTGKTPFVEYLVGLLKGSYQMATLSRGYRRRTRGFLLAAPGLTAADIGDEPTQLYRKFPDITVSVGEDRVSAISALMKEKPDTELVILDDAFQHRAVQAHLNILLTDYSQPHTLDRMLPAGNLRDHPSSASRADIHIVTKCPADMSAEEAAAYRSKLAMDPSKPLFFSHLEYSELRDFHTWEPRPFPAGSTVLLVCGIAFPAPLVSHLESKAVAVEMMAFRDHHPFTWADVERIRNRFLKMSGNPALIVTTEKDAVRLEAYRELLADLPIRVQPVAHAFMFSAQQVFEGIIGTFMQGYANVRSR